MRLGSRHANVPPTAERQRGHINSRASRLSELSTHHEQSETPGTTTTVAPTACGSKPMRTDSGSRTGVETSTQLAEPQPAKPVSLPNQWPHSRETVGGISLLALGLEERAATTWEVAEHTSAARGASHHKHKQNGKERESRRYNQPYEGKDREDKIAGATATAATGAESVVRGAGNKWG